MNGDENRDADRTMPPDAGGEPDPRDPGEWETVVPDRSDRKSFSAFLRSKLGRSLEGSSSAPGAREEEGPDADRYAVRGEIARGGMGAIVEILDQDIGRPVAMKVILGHEDRERVERFVREARITGALEHPNIVPVHELGRTADPSPGAAGTRPYFTMKLVRGESLESILDALVEKKAGVAGTWTLPALLQVFLKVCDAVAFAHSRGVIHRDLKPENVMVGAFGEVLVMDWGLAKNLGDTGPPDGPPAPSDPPGSSPDGKDPEGQDPSDGPRRREDPAAQVTLDGDVMGTPAYMPPEQARGRVREVDERSDVFALGGILYRVLTLEPPYDGETSLNVLVKAQKGEVIPPRRRSPWLKIPKELESICMKALAADRKARYRSVELLAEDVRAWQDHRPVSAHRAGVLTRVLRFMQRHPAGSLSGGVAAVLLSLGGAVTGVLWAEGQAAGARAREQAAVADAEKARAEAEGLRAQRAERERAVAQSRADAAEALLEKGRRVSAVLRSAELELGTVLLELKRVFYSTRPLEEKRARAAAHWARVDAFEKTVPTDDASRAAWLAVKGWLTNFSLDARGADALFEASRHADPDVAYGPLYEALIRFSAYMRFQALPSPRLEGDRIVFAGIPQETEEMRRVREKFETALEKARRAQVWGETAAADFDAVLTGFRAIHRGDLEAAEGGLTRALAIPEMSWLADEIHFARAFVRYQRQDIAGAIGDVRRVLETQPENPRPLYFLSGFLGFRAVEAWAAGRDATALFEENLAAIERACACAGAPDPQLLYGRGSSRYNAGLYRHRRGGEGEALLKAALADMDEVLRMRPGDLSAYDVRMRSWTILADHAADRDGDPRPMLQNAVENCTAMLRLNPDDAATLGVRASLHASSAQEDARRGLDPSEPVRLAFEDASRALERDPRCAKALWARGTAHRSLAEFQELAGKDPSRELALALEALDEALRNGPGDHEASRSRCRVRFALARRKMILGLDPAADLAAALADADRAVQGNPAAADPWILRGTVRVLASRHEAMTNQDPTESLVKAVADFDEGARIQPRSLDAASNAGNALMFLAEHDARVGKDPRETYERALERFDRALGILPTVWNAHAGKGRVLENLGRLEEAVASYEKALELAGDRYPPLKEWLDRARRKLEENK